MRTPDRSRAFAIAALLLGALVPAVSAAESQPQTPPEAASQAGSEPRKPSNTELIVEYCRWSGRTLAVEINWDALANVQEEIKLDRAFVSSKCGDPGRRITEGDVVVLTVKRFNFLKYEVRVEREEESVQAYVLLNQLWTQILGLGRVAALAGGQAQPAASDPFLEALLLWEDEIGRLDTAIDSQLSNYPAPGLSATDVAEIAAARDDIATKVSKVEEAGRAARKAAIDDTNNPTQDKLALLRDLRSLQDEVMARADAFDQRAELVAEGGRKVLKAAKAGTVVTATVSAVERSSSSESEVLTVKYFAASRLPVVLHAGYGQSDLGDFEFEKVRTLEGLEAYDLVNDSDEREDFMLFMGVPFLTRGADDEYRLMATLGTGLEEPGDVLFAGLSVQLFKRFVLSYGLLSAEVAEGVDPFVEQVGDALESRELFATVDKRRDWGRFWGVSIVIDF